MSGLNGNGDPRNSDGILRKKDPSIKKSDKKLKNKPDVMNGCSLTLIENTMLLSLYEFFSLIGKEMKCLNQLLDYDN